MKKQEDQIKEIHLFPTGHENDYKEIYLNVNDAYNYNYDSDNMTIVNTNILKLERTASYFKNEESLIFCNPLTSNNNSVIINCKNYNDNYKIPNLSNASTLTNCPRSKSAKLIRINRNKIYKNIAKNLSSSLNITLTQIDGFDYNVEYGKKRGIFCFIPKN